MSWNAVDRPLTWVVWVVEECCRWNNACTGRVSCSSSTYMCSNVRIYIYLYLNKYTYLSLSPSCILWWVSRREATYLGRDAENDCQGCKIVWTSIFSSIPMIALDEGCYGIPFSIVTPRYYWISDACILNKLLNQSPQSPLKICTSFLFLLLHLCIHQYHIVHVSLSSRITPYVCHYAQRHIFYNHSMSDMSFHTSSPPNPFIPCDAHSW